MARSNRSATSSQYTGGPSVLPCGGAGAPAVEGVRRPRLSPRPTRAAADADRRSRSGNRSGRGRRTAHTALGTPPIPWLRQVVERIDPLIVVVDAKVEVATRGVTSRTFPSNCLPAMDSLAVAYRKAGHVAVERFPAVAVHDDDVVAVAVA